MTAVVADGRIRIAGLLFTKQSMALHGLEMEGFFLLKVLRILHGPAPAGSSRLGYGADRGYGIDG
jgi:hypothetical protein